MKRAPFVVSVLALTACAPVIRPAAPDDPRARALADVRQGANIRVTTSERGTVEGRFAGWRADSLVIELGCCARLIPVATIEAIQVHSEASIGGMVAAVAAVVFLPDLLETLAPSGRGRLLPQVGDPVGNIFVLAAAGLGLAVGGLASGWGQAWPARFAPIRWTDPAPASVGGLRADVRLSRIEVGPGDSVIATLALSNATMEPAELLERACGPLLVLIGPGGREWMLPPCAPGLAVTRVVFGTVTRELRFAADLPPGIYQLEARIVWLSPRRGDRLGTAGAVRFAARAGLVVR